MGWGFHLHIDSRYLTFLLRRLAIISDARKMSQTELFIFSWKTVAPLVSTTWVTCPSLCFCLFSHSSLSLGHPEQLPASRQTAPNPSSHLSILSPQCISNLPPSLCLCCPDLVYISLRLPFLFNGAPPVGACQSILWETRIRSYLWWKSSTAFYCRPYNPQNSFSSTWHSPDHLLNLISYSSSPSSPFPASWSLARWSQALSYLTPPRIPFLWCVLLTCLISTQPSGLRRISLFQKHLSTSFSISPPSFSYWSYKYRPSWGWSQFAFIYLYMCMIICSILYFPLNYASHEVRQHPYFGHRAE